MAYITYRIGHENSTIVETDSYSESIFADQYRHSVSSIENFLKYEVADNLQIISFCGERGSGKSSCLKSVLGMLKESEAEKSAAAISYLKSLGLTRTINTHFEIPTIIDPSFFDKNNNILELILGQLYGNLLKFEHENRMLDRITCNRVYDSFSRIRDCLLTIHGSEHQSFNDYSDLNVLANGVRLKDEIQNLFKDYLKLIAKDKLIIVVDDIDLNAKGAYDMCEQIRKYLSVPQCIILISYKYEQLFDVIAYALKSSYVKNSQDELNNMVNRYLDKLIPSAQRVHIPIAYNFYNRRIRIIDGDKVLSFPKGSDVVKDAVVNLIFQKTRFLFYNSKGAISPIVPNNLRDLFQLVGMLWNMPMLPPNKKSTARRDILENNKHEFKTYFFNYWTKCLNPKHICAVKEWTINTPDSTLNKTIVHWLGEEFKDVFKRNYDTEIGFVSNLLASIKSDDNFTYNVSIGDVFYLINLLEQDILSPQQERILFFIKSYYSIRLFETYDIITEVSGKRYPLAPEDEGIYRVDHRFDHTNDLQRLLNGDYFTFIPGELIRNNPDGWTFDTRIIKGGKDYLTQLIVNCLKCVNDYDRLTDRINEIVHAAETPEIKEEKVRLTSEIDQCKRCFRLAEFFMLTISRQIIQKELKDFKSSKDKYRENVVPNALQSYNSAMGYYVFNILTPFYALANPQYTYSKFNRIAGIKGGEEGVFEFAITHDFTLLNQMIIETNDGDSACQEDCLNRLQSDAIIRNAEVLVAIFENAKSLRNTDKDTSGIQKISAFYKSIYDSGLSTHRVGNDEGDKPYRIRFSFLKVLISFIDNDLKDAEMANMFYAIFDAVEQTLSEEKKKSQESVKASGSTESKQKPKEASLSPIEKFKFAEQLTNYLGTEELTASQIWERLRELYSPLKNADDKDLRTFVSRKKGNGSYTMSQLTDFIIKSEERYNQWQAMINELYAAEIEKNVPF